jgi:putative transposase
VPQTYDPEFRRRVLELVRAGRPVRVVAAELGLAEATVYRWKAQDLIDRGVKPGLSTSERGELAAARQRIKELETELALVKQAAKLFEEGVRPKPCARSSLSWPGKAFPPGGAAASSAWRPRGSSCGGAERPRHASSASRGTYGWRRVNAELVYGHGVVANRKTVRKIMRAQGLDGLPGSSKRFRGKANMATAADLVERRFDRPAPDQLWVTDITGHPTREGKVYCCVVLDVFSRRVVGWSIDSHQATPLVTNALGMAISNTPACPSVAGSAGPAWSPRWAPSVTPTTMPWSSPSGPTCRPNSSTVSGGGPASSSPTRSLSIWRSSTIGSDATARWAGAPS